MLHRILNYILLCQRKKSLNFKHFIKNPIFYYILYKSDNMNISINLMNLNQLTPSQK